MIFDIVSRYCIAMKKYVDVHSHIAWDIDDGIPSIAECEKALEIAAEDGIRMIASTPHLIPGRTDLAVIENRQKQLKKVAREFGIEIRTGAELFMNRASMDAIAKGMVRPYEGTNYQLCEYDVRRDLSEIEYADEPLYEMKIRGITPVIAHVERYFHKNIDLDVIEHWRDQGCIIQVNRTSLLARGNKIARNNAWKVVDAGLADLVATDTHRTSGPRIPVLSDVYEEIAARNGEKTARILCIDNPAALLAGEPLKQIPEKPKKGLFGWLRK